MSEASAVETNTSIKKFGRERLVGATYELDLKGVATASVQENDQQSTFIETLRKLSQVKITEMPRRGWSTGSKQYVTDSGTIVVKGETQLVELLTDLVGMVRNGVDIECASWLYYDCDRSIDADVMHTFFVVYDGKVVDEAWKFSSEDPVILKPRQENQPIWRSHPHFREALECYWYRRFYTETLTGKLMVLRPDEPTLYHYERAPGQARDTLLESAVVTLQKIYLLLLVAIPLLAAIAFPSAKIYMALVAAYFVVDFLWRTRKPGERV